MSLSLLLYFNFCIFGCFSAYVAYTSTPGGALWQETLVDTFLTKIISNPNETVYVGISYSNDLYYSLNKQNWTLTYHCFNVYEFNVAYGNGIFIAAGHSGCFATSNDGINWVDISAKAVGQDFLGISFDDLAFIATAVNGNVFLNFDKSGVNWFITKFPFPYPGVGHYIGGTLFVPNNTDAISDDAISTILMSQDLGQTWTTFDSSNFLNYVKNKLPPVPYLKYYGISYFQFYDDIMFVNVYNPFIYVPTNLLVIISNYNSASPFYQSINSNYIYDFSIGYSNNVITYPDNCGISIFVKNTSIEKVSTSCKIGAMNGLKDGTFFVITNNTAAIN